VIAWLHSAALIGLAALAGPLVVHLLRRPQARRIVVPSVRFVAASELSAIRMRRPSDPWLLALRMAIVAVVALAGARPLLLSSAREASWSNRLARAVVVDTSESARPGIDPAQVAAEAAADPGTVIETPDMGEGLRRAAAWLARSPPARREIVVLSDFQRGAMTPADVAQIPDAIGLRLVPVRSAPADGAVALSILDDEQRLEARLTHGGDGTAIAYDASAMNMDGLEVRAPAAAGEAVASLLRVVRRAGALAPSLAQPTIVTFPGAEPDSRPVGEAAPWAIAAADRLLRSPAVAGIDLRATPAERALVVDVDADPASLEAAIAVQAALDARHDLDALGEHEPDRIPETTLQAWSRPARPANPAGWRQTDESDGRWLWGIALLLLAAEGVVRRRSAGERARAAHAA
jgi:hypothetical protein